MTVGFGWYNLLEIFVAKSVWFLSFNNDFNKETYNIDRKILPKILPTWFSPVVPISSQACPETKILN